MNRLAALGAFALTLLLGPYLPGAGTAVAGEPVRTLELTDDLPPPSARVKTLLIGTAVTGGFYGGALAASYGWSQDPGAADLRIPFVGPWLKVGQTTLCADLPTPTSSRPCSDATQVLGGVMAVISGLGQLAGLALIIEGTVMRTRAPARTALNWAPGGRYRLRMPGTMTTAQHDGFRRPTPVAFSVVPVLSPSTLGAVVTGSF